MNGSEVTSLMVWETLLSIVKALHISPQHLSKQRKLKRNQFQKPVVHMTKDEVDKESLKPFVQMPEGIEMSVSVVGWSS